MTMEGNAVLLAEDDEMSRSATCQFPSAIRIQGRRGNGWTERAARGIHGNL